MSNMSYCMFQNTNRDLMKCYESLIDVSGDNDGLTEEEISAYYAILEVCRDMIAWSERHEPKEFFELGNEDDEDE